MNPSILLIVSICIVLALLEGVCLWLDYRFKKQQREWPDLPVVKGCNNCRHMSKGSDRHPCHDCIMDLNLPCWEEAQ